MYKHVLAPNNQVPNGTTTQASNSNDNDNDTDYSPTISQSDYDIKVKQMIERQNNPANKWYYEFI